MRRTVAAAAAVLASFAASLLTPAVAAAGPCGLPDTRPLHIEFSDGSVKFRADLFARPGLVLATNGVLGAEQLRARGAQTVYWWMKLEQLVGYPDDPHLPESVLRAADLLYDRAVTSTRCATPLIALNELRASTVPAPWTEENARYRENVLLLLRHLSVRGAHPALLLPSNPNTAGEAATWWGAAAQVSTLVREVYFRAPEIVAQGPIAGSRTMRVRMRDAVRSVGATGLPPQRIGIMLGFQSGGLYGRARLTSSEAWLRFVKLNALAANHVAREFGIGSVWSWGWGTFNRHGADRDKPVAACVYLWARDNSLCDAPAVAPFNFSLTEGQLVLPEGLQCKTPVGPITIGAVDTLARITRDREAALAAIFARLVERAYYRVPSDHVAAAEREIVTYRFGGDQAAYVAELAKLGITRALAHTVLADELRRQARPPEPSWLEAIQAKALRRTTCLRDELPLTGEVRLAAYLHVLQLPL